MYCIKCGVKMGEGQNVCPLCGLKVYHPELEEEKGTPLYPADWTAHYKEKSRWRFILTVSHIIALISCVLIDMIINKGLSWSAYVIAGIISSFVVFILPMWFRKPYVLVFLPIDFAVALLLLLFINLISRGSWFLSFAFPVTAMYGIIFTAFAVLFKFTNGRLFLLGGGSIVIGCSTMLVEFLLHITFGLKMFTWSLYPASVMTIIGIFWIIAGIVKPLGNYLRKKFFI